MRVRAAQGGVDGGKVVQAGEAPRLQRRTRGLGWPGGGPRLRRTVAEYFLWKERTQKYWRRSRVIGPVCWGRPRRLL